MVGRALQCNSYECEPGSGAHRVDAPSAATDGQPRTILSPLSAMIKRSLCPFSVRQQVGQHFISWTAHPVLLSTC